MRLSKALLGAFALTFVAATASAAPIQLLTNGNFEAGASLAGPSPIWLADRAASSSMCRAPRCP